MRSNFKKFSKHLKRERWMNDTSLLWFAPKNHIIKVDGVEIDSIAEVLPHTDEEGERVEHYLNFIAVRGGGYEEEGLLPNKARTYELYKKVA